MIRKSEDLLDAERIEARWKKVSEGCLGSPPEPFWFFGGQPARHNNDEESL